MRTLWSWSLLSFLALVAAGSVFFSQWPYAASLVAAALLLVFVGVRVDGPATSHLLVVGLLVVMTTYASALVHIASPDFVVELGLLGQIAKAELTTWGGLLFLFRYTLLRLVIIVFVLLLISRTTRQSSPSRIFVRKWIGFAGAVHLPCAFAVAQPALNVSVYDPTAFAGRVEAFALGYLLHPTVVYLISQVLGVLGNRDRLVK